MFLCLCLYDFFAYFLCIICFLLLFLKFFGDVSICSIYFINNFIYFSKIGDFRFYLFLNVL
jgi:hypothetical protein